MDIITKFLLQLKLLLRIWLCSSGLIAIGSILVVVEFGTNITEETVKEKINSNIPIIVLISVYSVLIVLVLLTEIIRTVKTFMTARNLLEISAHEKVNSKVRNIKNCLLCIIIETILALGIAGWPGRVATIVAIAILVCRIIVWRSTVALRKILAVQTTQKI